MSILLLSNYQPYFSALPHWARWLARDADGQWWAYEAEPHQHDNGWYENEVGRSEKLQSKCDLFEWQSALIKIDIFPHV